MALDETQAAEVLKAPKNRQKIESAKQEESKLRVFTEVYDENEIKGEFYFAELLKTLKNRVEKKYDRVTEFFRFPLPIVPTSDAILNDFYKIFDGKNRFFDVQAERDIDRLTAWISDFRLENWIEENIKDVFKNKPNSFVVLDSDGTNTYLLNIDSERLVDVDFKDKHGNLNYIAFIHSRGKNEKGTNVTFYSVYDDEYFRVFSKEENSDLYVLVSEESHQIGYCPARSFISTPSSNKNYFKRRVAFTTSTSKMEDYTFFDVFRNYVDHYAPFPVTEAPEKPCANQECTDGYVQEQVVVDVRSGKTKNVLKPCLVCKGGKDKGMFAGPGTHIGIRVQPDTKKRDASNLFKMIFPDTDKLKYTPEKLQNLEVEIKNGTVGVNGMVSKEAINEMQAKGGFESMESVLLRNKKELDRLYKWIVETVAKFFYPGITVEVSANYGTEFYLVSEEQLQQRFKAAKENGLPIEEQLQIYFQLIETKYRGNPSLVERQKLLTMVDPLPLISVNEALELNARGIITTEELRLKINFLNFISKFENDNGLITRFGVQLPIAKRVDLIKQTLNNFNNENSTSE